MSHRTCGSSPPCTRHPIHACAPVCCVVVVLFTRLLFLFVPLLSFRPFQMSSSEFHERLKSKDLRDFRLGTVATSDHETPLTQTAALCFCSCGRNLKHGRSVTQFPKDNHDLNSIDGYVNKKNSRRGPKHGQSERQMRFHKAKELLRKAKKHGYPTILSRWEGEETCRSSLMTGVSRGRHFEFRPTCFGKTRLHSYEKRKTTILAAMGVIEK